MTKLTPDEKVFKALNTKVGSLTEQIKRLSIERRAFCGAIALLHDTLEFAIENTPNQKHELADYNLTLE